MRKTSATLFLALLAPVALSGCGRDIGPPPSRVAVPIPGEDPTVQRGNTQQPVDATTIPGVTGR